MKELPSDLPQNDSSAGEPFMTADDLSSRVWLFRENSHVYARQVRLLSDRRISGYYHPNEHAWELRNGRVVFLNIANRVTASFRHLTRDVDGRLTMASDRLALEETAPYQKLAPDASGFPIDIRLPGAQPGAHRRNLVLLFGNENSLHRAWPRDIPPSERNWDLCISFYGDAAHYHDDLGVAEFSSLQTGIRKPAASHAAFGRGSPLWNYDRVWLADDDLMLSWSDVNALFNVSDNLGLAIAQPALAPGSEVTMSITRQQQGVFLRYTSYVEAMAPCFSRDALELCIPVFERQVLGWGADHVWSRLIGPPHGRIAIIDAVPMMHTRPLASLYSWDTAKAEEQVLLNAYGLREEIMEYGRISI